MKSTIEWQTCDKVSQHLSASGSEGSILNVVDNEVLARLSQRFHLQRGVQSLAGIFWFVASVQ